VKGLINVLRFKLGILGDDLICCFTGGEQPKEPRDREPEPPDARLSGADVWIDCDSGKLHQLRLTDTSTARYGAAAGIIPAGRIWSPCWRRARPFRQQYRRR
jgi:hypothetical protein